MSGLLVVPTVHAEPPKPEPDLEIETKRRQRLNAEELLGFERWHSFEQARFDIQLYDHAFTPSLSERPELQEDLEDTVASTLLRLAKKRIERDLQLTERRDEFRARMRGVEVNELRRERARPGLDVSPRFTAGSRTTLGAKLSLDGSRSRFWRGASLRLMQDVIGSNSSIKLSFRERFRSVYLAYHTDHHDRGEAIDFGLRISY